MNLLAKRVQQIEAHPVVERKIERPEPHSVVLQDVSKIAKVSASARSVEKSVYDFPKGEVRITKVQFKSKKNGKKDLNGEWVEVTGYDVDLSGYKLYDKGRKHTFKFPEGFRIYGPVKVFTGKGRNTNTRLYWKQPRPVWNDAGDVASLADKNNKVISQVKSEPTFSFKILK
ncbi:TPA: lamin tail domain-containing protein [Candidatus Woesearchaeota archaeon]|nr:lamin tail domain-containing protein [Candidatus Woesearchaeota archaeon]